MILLNQASKPERSRGNDPSVFVKKKTSSKNIHLSATIPSVIPNKMALDMLLCARPKPLKGWHLSPTYLSLPISWNLRGVPPIQRIVLLVKLIRLICFLSLTMSWVKSPTHPRLKALIFSPGTDQFGSDKRGCETIPCGTVSCITICCDRLRLEWMCSRLQLLFISNRPHSCTVLCSDATHTEARERNVSFGYFGFVYLVSNSKSLESNWNKCIFT